jgi:hypothetical protein
METTQMDRDFAAIDTITAKFKELLGQNWVQLRTYAADPEAGGKIGASFGLAINFTGKTPCGSLKIGYGRKRRKDDAEFYVEDPDQVKLPIDVPQDGGVVGVQFGPDNSQGNPVVREVAEGLSRIAEAMPEGQSVTISSGGEQLAKIDGRNKGGKR